MTDRLEDPGIHLRPYGGSSCDDCRLVIGDFRAIYEPCEKHGAVAAIQAENASLRARVRKLEEALLDLSINANRILDVYPRDARGTYFDDLRLSVFRASEVRFAQDKGGGNG